MEMPDGRVSRRAASGTAAGRTAATAGGADNDVAASADTAAAPFNKVRRAGWVLCESIPLR